ncbi:MAG: cupredoxin domain-containing protein [Proteobacteria bacterium]|nr:cupredoxin domain-containing protein [Pseudomonadota bacterium]
MNKKLLIALSALAVILAVGGVYVMNRNGAAVESASTHEAPVVSDNNVHMENGKQIVEITVKGGYSPKTMSAKAGVPTIIRFITNDTFDCSSTVVIPSLHSRTHLPLNGSTEVELPAQQPGTELTGMCGMGMYNFSIKFSG